MTLRSLHFGSAMIDIITLVANDDIERATFQNEGTSFLMLETGRKLPAESITTHVGGGACNTAVSLARQGWDAAILAKVGDDLNAGAVRAHLTTNDVGDRLITSAQATGTAVMIASHDRNASIFVHRGANEHLAPDDLPGFDGVDLVYVAPLSSGSADCFPLIVAGAKKAGAMVAVNPGIRQLTNRLSTFLGAMGDLDLISINRAEADALIPAVLRQIDPGPAAPIPEDAPALMRRGLRAAGLEMGLIPFLQAVRDLGPKWVSLTDGTDGAYLAGPDGVIWHPSLPAEVAGTAGAGDAFCSTLTGALASGTLPARAMFRAALNSASVVSHIDTTTGLQSAEALASQTADAAPQAIVLA